MSCGSEICVFLRVERDFYSAGLGIVLTVRHSVCKRVAHFNDKAVFFCKSFKDIYRARLLRVEFFCIVSQQTSVLFCPLFLFRAVMLRRIIFFINSGIIRLSELTFFKPCVFICIRLQNAVKVLPELTGAAEVEKRIHIFACRIALLIS